MKQNKLTKLLNTIKKGTIKHSPDILLACGIVSGITSTVLAVKATPKALILIEKEKSSRRTNNEDDNLTKMEVVKTAWKPYIPSAISGAVGIACIIGAHTINTKRNAIIATAYKITETAYRDYKDAVVEEIGSKKEEHIRERIARKHVEENPVSEKNSIISTGKGKTLFFDEEFNNYFESDMQAVKKAVNDLNFQILNEDYASVNDLYYLLGIPPMKSGDSLGWSSAYGGCEMKYSSIITDDDRPCIVLNYGIAPRYDYSKLM